MSVAAPRQLGALNLEQAPSPIQVDVIDSWANWIQAYSAAITAAGLILAGIWAFFRFRRGRTFMPRCSIDLEAVVFGRGRSSGLVVHVHVVNVGDSAVRFVDNSKGRVEVSVISPGSWKNAPRGTCIQWPAAHWALKKDLLGSQNARKRPTELEPSQDLRRSCLFRLPSDWLAAQVTCLFSLGAGDDARVWRADEIVVSSRAPANFLERINIR